MKATGSVTELPVRIAAGLSLGPGVSIHHDIAYFDHSVGGNTGIYVVDLTGSGEVRTLIDFPQFNEWGAIESPDGKFLAFVSNDSGQDDIFVCTFPDAKRRWKISTGGGRWPYWSPDGRTIYYTSPTPEMMAVTLTTDPEFSASRPRSLFSMAGYKPYFSVNATNGKFLLIRNESTESPPERIQVVVNWFEELKRLVPVE